MRAKEMRSCDNFEFILESLGVPLYRGDCYAIYNADSSELLKRIPDESVDLYFTSPPYNIGKESNDFCFEAFVKSACLKKIEEIV